MKNNRLLTLLVLLLSTLVIASCNPEKVENKTAETTEPNFEDAELVELNPERNELAKLMLLMYAKTEAIKIQIEQGPTKIDDSYLEDIKKVTEVNNGIDGHSFTDFSEYNSILMEQAIELQNTTTNQNKAYNNMINSCIICHEQFCPKMVQKIEKLVMD